MLEAEVSFIADTNCTAMYYVKPVHVYTGHWNVRLKEFKALLHSFQVGKRC